MIEDDGIKMLKIQFIFVVFGLTCLSSVEGKDFKNFLIMNVCVGSTGTVDRTMIPGLDGCIEQRDIATGERPYYHLRDFPNSSPGSCRSRISGREITNIPVMYNGKIRALGYTDVGYDPLENPACTLTNNDPVFRDRARAIAEDRGSIRWVETAEGGIGFLMASGDGTDFSYWTTPVCNTFPNDSRRFYRGWPLSKVTIGAPNVFGWTFQDTDLNTADVAPPLDSFGTCPASSQYNSAFTLWTVTDYRYKSQAVLESVISYHFTGGDSRYADPGDSRALERLYFTDEWGYSRYELWRREDYYGVSNADRQRVKDEAENLFNTGRCSAPYDAPRNPTPDMTTGTLITSGKYAEKIINKSDGSNQYWYVVNCRDYSRIVSDPSGFLPSLLDLDPQYQAFWR